MNVVDELERHDRLAAPWRRTLLSILQEGIKILARQLTVAQDSHEEAGSDDLGPMRRDRGDAPVRMSQPMMATFDADEN